MAISLKHVKIEEKLLWRAYRKSPTLFRTVPSRPHTASHFPRLGVHNPTPKLQSLLSQERLKLRTANLADAFRGSIRTQTHEKFWRKGSVGVSRDCPSFLSTGAYYLRNGKARNFKLDRYIHRDHANKSPLKIWENRERGRIQGLPKFLSTPIFSGTDKATNFKFGSYIHRLHPKKSPLKFWEKMECGRIQGLPNFFQYPLLSQEQVKLRT